MRWQQGLLVIGLPVGLLAACLWSNPFPQVIAEQTEPLSHLSSAQKTNVGVAIRHLEGQVLSPGDTFSFNRVVGPRTTKRGYLAAPSYLGKESPATVGGGICLLSSALYQLVLQADLRVIERVPHLKTIYSVPPGLDATVWYGGADLRFRNDSGQPLRLVVSRQPGSVVLRFYGGQKHQPLPIRKTAVTRSVSELLVTVFQGERMISRDVYQLTP